MRAMTGAILALAMMPGLAAAETLQSENLTIDLTRRVIAMTSDTGKAIRGEQVYVSVRRRDGQPIGADGLRSYVPFAERAACQGRKVLVSLMVGAADGAGQYEVLCAMAN